ncbi:MAG: signal peptidase II [Emergencia sp.]
MRYYITAVLLLAADQLSKAAVRSWMQVGDSISIIGDFFRLTYIRNSGAAFSILSGQRLLLVIVPVLAIAAALWYLHRHRGEHWSLYTSWMLIITGGIGNLIDRIVFGSVTDMIDFSIFPPIFNVADIYVTLGCGLFILYVLAGERLKKQ